MSIKPFYSSSFLRALAEGLINPFIPVFALYLGATKTLIGLLSSLPKFTSLFFQLFWGSLADVIRKKRFLIIFGGIFWALFWIPIAFVKSPAHLIILVTLQALFSSISIPAWTVSLIRTTPSYRRGKIVGRLNTYSGMGTFFGTLIGGIILNKFGFIHFLFFMVCFLGILSRMVFIPFKPPTIPVYRRKVKEILKGTFNLSRIRREKKLMSLIKSMIFLNFAVGIAGPFFSVYIVEGLGGTKLDVGIISAVGVASAIVFYRSWGTLIDYLGRKTIMLSCIIPISFVPFIYAIVNHVYWLYLYAIISNISWAGFNLAVFTYLSDVIPREKSSSYVAMYNMLTGLSGSIAPFVGGMIADLTSIWFVFILSTLLRISSIHFLDELEEKTGFKPRGIFKFEYDYFGISYRLETFVSTYSLAVEEVRKNLRLIRFRRYLRRFKSR